VELTTRLSSRIDVNLTSLIHHYAPIFKANFFQLLLSIESSDVNQEYFQNNILKRGNILMEIITGENIFHFRKYSQENSLKRLLS